MLRYFAVWVVSVCVSVCACLGVCVRACTHIHPEGCWGTLLFVCMYVWGGECVRACFMYLQCNWQGIKPEWFMTWRYTGIELHVCFIRPYSIKGFSVMLYKPGLLQLLNVLWVYIEGIDFRGMTARKVSRIKCSWNSSLSAACMHAILKIRGYKCSW